jgi:4'-phosphopantetheinyl transferase
MTGWAGSPAAARATAGGIDLWSAHVDGSVEAGAMAMLDERERARAERFRFPRDRERFIARHVFYRRVLARYLGAGKPVVLSTTPQGRPMLDPACGIDFNASHSDGLAVIAVSRGPRVGVDVERLHPLDDALAVAAGHMSERELEGLRAMPRGARDQGFLSLWTRKEAIVKLSGDGLSFPLADLDTAGQRGRGVVRLGHLAGGSPCTWATLDVGPGFVASVAIEGDRLTVRPMKLAEVAP